jgi:AcrR family transcriptional regulator
MFVKGVSATTLDDVRAASSTSKSQLYYHFADKDALVLAIIDLQAADILERRDRQLRRLNSIRGLERWRDALVQGNTLRHGAHGCPLGSLSSEVSDHDEDARLSLAQYFVQWEGLLAAGLARMRDAGVLSKDADPERLATGLMAALQGGYLLAQTARDSAPMRIALDMGIDQVRAFSVAGQAATTAK